jgi:plasmid stabilization system protein ParE
MTRVVVSDIASQDQADILLDLTTKAGLRTAAKYDGLLNRLFDLLTDFPEISAPRSSLGISIRIRIVLATSSSTSLMSRRTS